MDERARVMGKARCLLTKGDIKMESTMTCMSTDISQFLTAETNEARIGLELKTKEQRSRSLDGAFHRF